MDTLGRFGHILLPETNGNVTVPPGSCAGPYGAALLAGDRSGSIAKRSQAASMRLMERDELSVDAMLQKFRATTIGVRRPR